MFIHYSDDLTGTADNVCYSIENLVVVGTIELCPIIDGKEQNSSKLLSTVKKNKTTLPHFLR